MLIIIIALFVYIYCYFLLYIYKKHSSSVEHENFSLKVELTQLNF